MSAETPDERQVEVHVLGPITVVGPNGPLDPGGHKLRLLLALLVASAGRVVTTDRLIDGLWGEQPPASARKSLQVHVSNLRHSLGDALPVRTAGGGYSIPAESVDVDAQRFERAVDAATQLVASDPDTASRILDEALGWWSGPAYADLAAEEGIRAEATRLDELRLRALELRADAELQLGHHGELIGELETLVVEHPFRERFQAQHMLALYRAGRQAEAVRAYDRTRRVLVEELGLEPSAELAQLHRDILDHAGHLDLAGTTGPTDGPALRGPSRERGIRGFELREQLGPGRHGTIYRAFQRSVGREVALEVIDPDLADDPAFVRRFETECRTITRLEHPHVLTLLDWWREPGGAYLVTPWLRGGDVSATLGRGPWRPRAALRLIGQIGAALEHAHHRGIVHGHLTSSDVLLDDDDNGYLTGFGPAAPPTPTCDGPAVSVDIDALARFAYELLTGRPPSRDEPPAPTAFTRSELPSAFDEVMARALGADPGRRYATVADLVVALHQAFGAELAMRDATFDVTPIRNPYKGLRAFGEADAPDFFGRDALLAQLVEQVGTAPLTTVIGPSGCGKSSLVAAGLLPAMRRHGVAGRSGWVIAEMCPGSYPFEELDAALLRVAVGRPGGLLGELVADERGLMRVSKRILADGTDLLLVVDQFEELFSQPIDVDTRERFLANLLTVASDTRSRVRIVLTIRADFFDRPLRHAAFGRLMQAGLVPVTAPTEDELVEVITRPAEAAGLVLEPGLVAEILHDVEREAGALPLLEYALTELVDERDGHALTLEAYHRIGGVIGALARRAEQIHAALAPQARTAAREIFLRLVRVHDEGGDTRRRVRRTEIDDLHLGEELIETVLDAFGSYRLLTFDHDPVTRGPTVEVAHEALLREWPRYRSWIDDRREDLHMERRLADAVAEWLAADRDRSRLFRGAHLEQYEGWAANRRIGLTAGEREFLDESRAVADAATRTTARRRRIVLAAISSLAAMAVAFAIFALVQRDRADDNAAVAVEEAARANDAAATADELRLAAERNAAISAAEVEAAEAAAVTDPDLALLLAIHASERLDVLSAESPIATSALYQTLLDHDVAARVEGDPFGFSSHGHARIESVRWSPDGDRFLFDDGTGPLTIVDVGSGNVVATIADPSGDGIAVAHWDHAEDLLYVGSKAGSISVWDPTTMSLVDELELGGSWITPFWVSDGQILYLDSAPRFFDPVSVVAADLATGQVVFESPRNMSAIGVSSDGELLALWDRHDVVLVYRIGTWEQVSEISFDGLSQRISDRRWGYEVKRPAAAWVVGQHQLWVIDELDRLLRVDALDGERLDPILIEDVRASALVPSPDGKLLALILQDSSVRIHDAQTGSLVAEAPWDAPTFWVGWTPDSRRLAAIGVDISIVWQVSGPSAPEATWLPSGWMPTGSVPIVTARLADGGVFVGTARGDGLVTDRDGELRWQIAGHGESGGPAAVSADGATIATPGAARVTIRDADGTVRAEGPVGFVRPLAVSPDGRSIVVATAHDPEGGDDAVALVDGTTGELTRTIGRFLLAGRAAFTADGSLAVIPIQRVGTGASVAALWVVDVDTGTVVARGPDEKCLTTAAVSSDDRIVAAGACDGHVSLYDLAQLLGEQPWAARLGGADGGAAVQGLTFGPDAEMVVSTHADGRVSSWSLGADVTQRWSFDVGTPVGEPSIEDGLLRFGVVERTLSGAGERGGVIAVPLDRSRLLDAARETVNRDLTHLECRHYFGAPCSAG